MDARLPVEGIGRVLVILLGLLVLVDLISVGSGFMQLELLEAFGRGEVDPLAAERNDAREQAVGITYLLLFAVTAITWLIWFNRAYRNIDVFGGARSRETKWSVWAHIIPFISLYLPHRLMREAFTASAPASDDGARLVGWWWGLFLVSGVLGQINFRLFRDAESIPEFVAATEFAIFETLVDVPSALLAIAVVRTLSRWQTERGPGNIQLAKVFD